MAAFNPSLWRDAPAKAFSAGEWAGGAEGDRTPDLLIANEALSQLSYGPFGQCRFEANAA